MLNVKTSHTTFKLELFLPLSSKLRGLRHLLLQEERVVVRETSFKLIDLFLTSFVLLMLHLKVAEV